MIDKPTALHDVANLLLQGADDAAGAVLRERYPFEVITPSKRSYTERQMLSVFLRDGFIDRYSGQCLVFPALLRVLSIKLPGDFPFHKNWKVSETHPAYWELCPTLDHVVPVARGGVDDESNWVTTTQIRNSAKAHWTIEELGWELHAPGDLAEWDGLVGVFQQLVSREPELLADAYVGRWARAAAAAV